MPGRDYRFTVDALIPTAITKLLEASEEVAAVLLIGSTASRTDLSTWDDLDTQVYTKSKPALNSHYEFLNSSGKNILLSAYYYQLDPTYNPRVSVVEQEGVRVLYGRKQVLRHICVDRPRRIEPLPHELPRFREYHETFFNILVDIFFILNRYEARGKPNATKPRVARDGLRTIVRNFYQFYGIDRQIPKGTRWRKLVKETASLLTEKKYASRCRNQAFASAAIEMMAARYDS